MNINIIDILLLIILLWTSIKGFLRGLTGEVFRFIAFVAIFFCSIKFTMPLSMYISNFYPMPTVLSRVCAVVGIILGILIAVNIIKRIVQKIIEETDVLSGIEKLGGFFIGIAKGLVICFLIVIGLNYIPSPKLQNQLRNDTVIAGTLIAFSPNVYSFFLDGEAGNALLPGKLKEYLKKDNTELELETVDNQHGKKL
jgi:membrane protein required for colicin V production